MMFTHYPSPVGIKLQPIVELKTGLVIGYEVLSHFSDAVDSESYFRQVPSNIVFSMFNHQVERVTNSSSDVHYFINLPVRDLSRSDLGELIQISPDKKVVVELQDPEHLVGLTCAEQQTLVKNLNALHEQNIAVWLDDIEGSMLSVVRELNFRFDGIKIDKHEFWRSQSMPSVLNQLVKNCYQISPNVLIEGIETLQHREIAACSGASHLQGYLWPETII